MGKKYLWKTRIESAREYSSRRQKYLALSTTLATVVPPSVKQAASGERHASSCRPEEEQTSPSSL